MQKPDNLLIDITSAVLQKPNAVNWIEQAAAAAAVYGAEIGIQVHNSASDEELEKAAATGLKLSFHAPVQGRYMMNLAAEDALLSWQMIDEQAAMMQKYNVERAVFHASLMTDKPIFAFGHGLTYRECMMRSDRPELLRGDGSIFINDYTRTEEYLMRRERLKHNLQLLRSKYPQYCWCVENDFPAFVAGVLRGCDLAALEHEVCFDTGHMWAACKMLDMDFYEQMTMAMDSGRVQMIHLHMSRYTLDMPHHLWGDGHLPLDHPGTMDIKRIVQACSKYQVRHIVLEIADAGLNDVTTVLRYYFED